MRLLLAFACLPAAGVALALDSARELAAAGAPALALARVEWLQPADPAAARWLDWEVLRLELLARLKRHDEALKRASVPPEDLPPPALRRWLLQAAHAAVGAGQGALARDHLARLMWQLDPAPEETRAARLLVIESHLAERRGGNAFRAMLRFDQDYRPLPRAVAGRFVAALLELGLAREAVNWLAALDDGSALKLRLQLAAGLADPGAVIGAARARLARASGDETADYWRLIADAADRQGDDALQVEALEWLLDLEPAGDARAIGSRADGLWRAYSRAARTEAGRRQLLTGDDAAWLDLAARQLGARPPLSRALYAHLAVSASANPTRHIAQLQLVLALQHSGLERAALRLFATEPPGATELDPQARYRLGAIAESRGAPDLSVRFWKGLAAPPGQDAVEWQVRLAAAYWRAGMTAEAVNAARVLRAQETAPNAAAAGRALALAGEMTGAADADAAEALLSALLPLAEGAPARELLLALGAIAERAGRFLRAGDYFLRAALAEGTRAGQAPAVQARLSAARNLARAGLLEDAREQLLWVARHAQDPAQIETARRELARP
jgi:hypothetical protein